MEARFNQHLENLWPDYLKSLEAIGIVGLRSIQYDVLNAIVETRDIVIASPFGSGKTTAALLAIAWRLNRFEDSAGSCMVLTVESEQQVKRIESLITGLPAYDLMKVLPLYTTSDVSLFKNRAERLRQRPEVIVTTPDRLLVHLRVGNFSSSDVRYLIVDDIDIMHDKGMYRDLEKIFIQLENYTCRVLFSSTERSALMKRIDSMIRHNKSH